MPDVAVAVGKKKVPVPKGPAAEFYLLLVDRLSDQYGLNRDLLLLGGLKHKHDAIAAARRLIVVTLRDPPYSFSYPIIGLAMSRNHTSVMRLTNFSKTAVQELLIRRVQEENTRFQLENASKLIAELEQSFEELKRRAEVARPELVAQGPLATLRVPYISEGDEDDDTYDDPDKRYYKEVVALLKTLPHDQRQAVWVEACKNLFPETWESASQLLPREIRLSLD